MTPRSITVALLIVAGCSASKGGCRASKSQTSGEQAPTAATAAPAKAAATDGPGVIRGTVKLVGRPPPTRAITMDSDPYCARQQGDTNGEVVASASGALKNVAVRVVDGLTARYSPRAEEVVMDQQACMYRPRVLVAQAGQTVLIKNSDQTLHNIHTYRGAVTVFNLAEVSGMPPIRKKFASDGEVVKFKCDVHPWMTGYLVVTDNPFFAVTDGEGKFTIRGLPAGHYTVEIWHERLGRQKAEVDVGADRPAELNLALAIE
jgi:plastocyanin